MTSIQRRLRRRVRIPPFTAYLIVVSGWFFGFGLQTSLFPGVIKFDLGEPPDRLGLAQAALTAPMLFLLPLTGVLAERWDRRGVLASFHTLAALSAAGLVVLLASGILRYEVLVAYALVVGLAGAFVMPSRDSAINPVTQITQRMGRPDFTLQKAVIIASLVQFAAQIVGMGMGFLAVYTGPGPLFALQAAGLLIGAAAALTLPRLPAGGRGKERVWRSLKSGVAAVFTSPILRPMTVIMIAVGVFIVGGGFFIIIPVLVEQAYGADYGVLSGLFVTFWMGAFTANLVLARWGPVERPGRALLLSQLISIIGLGALAAPLPLGILFVLVFGWGLGAGVAISLSRAVIQENAPRDKVARVLSVYQLGLFGGMPLGAAIFGYVVDFLGPRQAALVPMGGLFLVMAWVALATPVFNIRRSEPAPRPALS